MDLKSLLNGISVSVVKVKDKAYVTIKLPVVGIVSVLVKKIEDRLEFKIDTSFKTFTWETPRIEAQKLIKDIGEFLDE